MGPVAPSDPKNVLDPSRTPMWKVPAGLGMAWLRKNGLGCCLDMANTSIYQHGINRTTIYNYIYIYIYIYAYISMYVYIYIYIRYFKIDICEFGVKRMGSISWYIPCIGG